MQLTQSQLRFLRQHNAFEALMWGGLKGRLCCALKIPESITHKEFNLVFEDLTIVAEDTTMVKLHFAIASVTQQFMKSGLKYTFNLTDVAQRNLIEHMTTAPYIYVYVYKPSKKKDKLSGPALRPHEWHQYMREKAQRIIEQYSAIERQNIIDNEEQQDDIPSEFFSGEKKINTSIAEQEVLSYTLPEEWQQRLAETPRTAKLLHYASHSVPLCLFVKVPPDTQTDELTIHLESIFTRWCKGKDEVLHPVVGLQLTLLNKEQHHLKADALFNLAYERENLSLLSKAREIDVIFVADEMPSKIMATKRSDISYEIRTQAEKASKELTYVTSPVIWSWGQEAYHKFYPPMKSFQIPKNQVIEDQQTAARGQIFERLVVSQENVSKQLELPTKLPPIERCILKLRQADSNDKPSWMLLLAAGLEHAQLFTWEKDALDLLEQKRQTLSKSQWPVISPPFPSPYVWFEFAQPLETPICKDTTAIYLFSSASEVLYRSSALRSLPEPEFTQWKRKNVEGSERERFSILVINTQGELVWSMSLPTTYDEGFKHELRPWLTPPWYSCPQRRCKMFSEQKKDGTSGLYWELCPACKEAQIFFSTWVMTAWQALLGEYRTVPDREEVLDRIGTRQAENKSVVEGYAWLRTGRVRTYTRLITYKDISQALKNWHELLHPRGSWVEALMKIDPKLVTMKEQRVSEHTRRYTSPRFTNMQGQETIIPSFTRKSPVRADLMNVPRKTEVVAKNGKENAKKRRK